MPAHTVSLALTRCSRMKKVIIFRNELLPRSETFILEQMRTLTTWHPVLTGYSTATNGLDVAQADIRILPGLTGRPWQRRWLHLCQYLGIAHGPTVRVLHSINANLIHAHFGTDAVDIWPSVRNLDIPMLVTLHGYDINIYREWWEAGRGGLRRRLYPRRLLRMAIHPQVHFIAVSHAIRRRAIECGIPSNKITVAYIGVDTNIFKPKYGPAYTRTKRILFVGRMVEKKAPLLLVNAFSKVHASINDSELVMIGEGPLLEAAKQLAKQLSLPVQFLGAQDSRKVLAQIQDATTFCLPSITAANGDAEGLPISILEALACGVPVVTSSRGADEVVVSGRNGITFAEGSEHALAAALIQALTGVLPQGNKDGHSGWRLKEQFSLNQTSLELTRIYNTLINIKPKLLEDI